MDKLEKKNKNYSTSHRKISKLIRRNGKRELICELDSDGSGYFSLETCVGGRKTNTRKC